VDVRRDAVEVMEAVDVFDEDGFGRKADPARETEERGVHEEPEGREEERFVEDDDPRGWEEERVPEAEEECRVREGVVEAEVEAGMDGEVAEPTIKATEAPVEGSWPCAEAAANKGRAVEGRAELPMETRRSAEPTAAEVHPTAEAGTLEGQRWRAGQ